MRRLIGRLLRILLRSLATCIRAVVGSRQTAEMGAALLSKVRRDAKDDQEALGKWRGLVLSILGESLEPDERSLLPTLEKRDRPPLNTWKYQNEVLQFPIRLGQSVLDIGSGGWPFSKATHLLDRYPDNTTHRVEALARDGRPFLVGDVTKLPFDDKCWDFVFCSHVLEHVDRPGDACREIMRVGRRGYVELPTRLSDVMFNFTRLTDHHKWHGLVFGQKLVFLEWQANERRDVGTSFFFSCAHSSYRNPFQSLLEANWDLFSAMLHWEDRFDFMVIDKTGRVIDASE